jgi:hypothetical protein
VYKITICSDNFSTYIPYLVNVEKGEKSKGGARTKRKRRAREKGERRTGTKRKRRA